MLKRMMVTLVVAALGIGVVGGMWSTAGRTVLAGHVRACAEQGVEGAAMGIADPNAPYDLRFIDEMTMHHQGAIMSAEMMIADSERPELRDLARRIQESQQRQIDQMREWRVKWYPDVPAPVMSMEPMADMTASMGGGMMDGGMMGGDQGDRMFLRMMIPHHQIAVDMGTEALQEAEHQELRGLAEEIIEGQSAEIEEMERYLPGWYGAGTSRDLGSGMQNMMQRMMGGC